MSIFDAKEKADDNQPALAEAKNEEHSAGKSPPEIAT
jgi:hypothetical protein